MRLLIYAMQSSGASAFCYFLGQRPRSVAIVDVWSRGITPRIETPYPVVAKATVNMISSVADHIASFVPDRTILFVRDPVAVYASLIKYDYANRFGTIAEKMVRLDREFARADYDAILRYEDFAARDPDLLSRVDALGWPCDASYYDMPRSFGAIHQFNAEASPWLARHGGDGWGFGNIKNGPIRRDLAQRPALPEIDALVASLSPALHLHYQEFWRAART
jgi:hypothetical protein